MSNRRRRIEQEVLPGKLPYDVANVVSSVDPDEKAFMLVEKNIASKDHVSANRYQVIYVNRGGDLSAFVRNLGPVQQDVGEFVFPLMWEYSVAEAADVANAWREESGMKEKLDERAEKSTLLDDFHTLQEVKRAVAKNRTVFGIDSTAAISQRNFRIKGVN